MKWEYVIFILPGVKRDPTAINNDDEVDGLIKIWLDALGAEDWECYFLQFIPYSFSADSKMIVKYAQNIKGYFKRTIKEE